MLLHDKNFFSTLFLDKLESVRGLSIDDASPEDFYIALSYLVRDQVMKKQTQTNLKTFKKGKKKQVYYFSLEFLLGRMLRKNMMSLGLAEVAEEALKELGINVEEIYDIELDPGLGNGGLGRLAACFMDSLAFLGIPGNGNSIRYKYGLFEQKIIDGYQVETPDNWLKNEAVWEVKKPHRSVLIKYYGNIRTDGDGKRLWFHHENYESVIAVPYDVPIMGQGNDTVNTLRLWAAEATQQFDYGSFSSGDYLSAVSRKYSAEAITEVLYPDDSNYKNRMLRLKQQYFFVSAGIQSVIRHYKKNYGNIRNLPDYVAIHINDTHPALTIPELMRILMDEEGLSWNEAWEITVKTISYTNHTLLPEALEKWPESSFSQLLPRIHMIVSEINERFCALLAEKFYNDIERITRMAIISHGEVRMGYLAVVGSHSINGVAQVHSELLKTELFKDFYEVFPERFRNMTNGVTHRRWLCASNPKLAGLISDAIGSEWIREPLKLSKLDEVGAVHDSSFLSRMREIKREQKVKLSDMIMTSNGVAINPDSIFDVQIKRIHAYKRQLLNILHIIDLYYRILDDPNIDITPRTFIFGGKAAPSYYFAKEVIKLVSVLSDKINKEPRLKDIIKVVFMENYRVSLAEKIFPASELSEQISTAGMEASGTGNMKFMMNGAVTIGTYDGANIEIFEAVGEGNFIPFGLTVPEVLELRRNNTYDSRDFLRKHERLSYLIHNVINTHPNEAGRAEFPHIYESLTTQNDQFLVLKDFDAYKAAQDEADKLYKDVERWSQVAAMNIAYSGRFSSDEVIKKYAEEIWRVW